MTEENNLQPSDMQNRMNTQTESLGEKPAPVAPAYRNPLKSLRTYQGDVQEIMAKNNTSLTTVAIAEQKRKEKHAEPVYEKKPAVNYTRIKNKTFLIGGSLLLILGIIIVIGVVYIKLTTKMPSVTKTDALISYNQVVNFPIPDATREQFFDAILAQKQSFKLPVNAVLYINTIKGTSTPVASEDLLTFIAPQIPPQLARSFDDIYMIGVYSFDTNEPFIILTTSDFGSSYAGMLKWEGTMASDIGKIFDITPDKGQKPYVFEDEAVKNKDLRIIKDVNRKTVLVYSFIDRNTLVITKNEGILSGIIGKYITNKMTR